MKWFSLVSASVMALSLCGGTVLAQGEMKVDEAAKTVLADSAKAIKALGPISFKVKRTSDGIGGMKLGGDATVKLIRPSGAPANAPVPTSMLSISGVGATDIPMEGPTDFAVSLVDGKTVTWVDNKAKVVHEQPFTTRSEGERQVNKIRSVLLPDFMLAGEPFEKELRSRNINKEPARNIGGEPCEIIKVEPEPGKQSITIGISIADSIPRYFQISRVINPQMSTVLTWELSDVKLDKLAPASFVIKTPDGYKLEKEEVKAPTADRPGGPALPPGGLAPGTAAPNFELTLAGGGKLTTADLKGSVCVLGFWGPLFPASKQMGAVMQELSGKAENKKVKFYGVACRQGADEEPAVQRWMGENKLTFRTALSGDQTQQNFNVRGCPSIVVINAEGKVAAFFESTPSAADLQAAIDAASKAVAAGK